MSVRRFQAENRPLIDGLEVDGRQSKRAFHRFERGGNLKMAVFGW